MAKTSNQNPPGDPADAAARRAAEQEASSRMAADAAARAQADHELKAAAALTQQATSAQLEPVASDRLRRRETVVEERVAVRSEPIGIGEALDHVATLFPAKARVLPGGEVVEARPAEEIDGERREVLIVSRVLHDNVDYSPMTRPRVTRAQFEALRLQGATGELLWEQLA